VNAFLEIAFFLLTGLGARTSLPGPCACDDDRYLATHPFSESLHKFRECPSSRLLMHFCELPRNAGDAIAERIPQLVEGGQEAPRRFEED